MIVDMHKAFIVSRKTDRDRLLEELRGLGVVHIEPVDPALAVADEKTAAAVETLARAVQFLRNQQPAFEKPQIDALSAAEETLTLLREAQEKSARLATLHRDIEQLAMWGEVRLEQFQQIVEAGLELRFFAVEPDRVPGVQADFVQVLQPMADGRTLVATVATVGRDGQVRLPEDVEEVALPTRDRPSIRAEAQKIDLELEAGKRRLQALAHLTAEIEARHRALAAQAEFVAAGSSGTQSQDLFAIQGWVPSAKGKVLGEGLAATGVEGAVTVRPPRPDEDPPTLIEYPLWTRPIQALFDMLGTIPGCREFDLSGFFMIAMPVFVAMLIGDGGYGFLFLVAAVLLRGRLKAAGGSAAANLILVFSLTTIAWGVLTGNFFGITPETIAQFAGYKDEVDGMVTGNVAAMLAAQEGAWAAVGRVVYEAAPLYRVDPAAGRDLIIQISFLIGCLHLVTAQLRQALGRWPDPRWLMNLGWAIVLPGMLGVIWQMFFIGIKNPWSTWIFACLGLGGVLVLLFTSPGFNPLKVLAAGVGTNIMPLVNTFSDTISYIRLMAVGLASYYIAFSFNLLGAQVAQASHWTLAVPILVLGHGLNIFMGVLAVLAHGVRLNMLEFSSNAGVQWSGYAYRPFTETSTKND